MLQQLIDKITEQQKAVEEKKKPGYKNVIQAGNQLKEICGKIPEAVEIVLQDLELPEMSIEKVEKKIEAFARKNNGIYQEEAEKIIKEFYGITAFSNSQTSTNLQETSQKPAGFIDLADFI